MSPDVSFRWPFAGGRQVELKDSTSSLSLHIQYKIVRTISGVLVLQTVLDVRN